MAYRIAFSKEIRRQIGDLPGHIKALAKQEIANLSDNPRPSHAKELTKLAECEPHPARFPQKLPEFFIKFLTESGDTVLDPFAGSNTTGAAAEDLGRKWIAFEIEQRYLAASAFRFLPGTEDDSARNVYLRLCENLNTRVSVPQGDQLRLIQPSKPEWKFSD